MSAYIVGKAHIDAMVTLAKEGPSGIPVAPWNAWYGPSWTAQTPDGPILHRAKDYAPDALGRMLIAENVSSVAYRYSAPGRVWYYGPEAAASMSSVDDGESLPGPVDAYYLRPYTHEDAGRPTAIAGLKMISCYTYQSCEHPEWVASEAAAFCIALQDSLIGHLPGYDEAAGWEWTSHSEVAR